MAKAGGAIPAWFWPDGVARRVPVPQQPLSRQVHRTCTQKAGETAFVTPQATVTFGELLQGAMQAAPTLQGWEPALACASVYVDDPVVALRVALAAWLAGKPVSLLNAADPARVELQLGETQGSVVFGSSGAPQPQPVAVGASVGGPLMVPAMEDWASFARSTKPLRPVTPRVTDKAVFLQGQLGTLAHSHFSLSAMAVGLTTFVPELKDMSFWASAPLTAWESLGSVIAGLLNGVPTVFPAKTGEWPAAEGKLAGGYTILTRGDADAIVDANRAPAYLSGLRHVFLSTGPFSMRWRKKLERILGRPVMTLWGMQEAGAVIAAHPTWIPLQAHGFQMVNVTLFPIDSKTGNVSIVPWGMINRAEIGVESVSAMAGYVDEENNRKVKSGTFLRTGQIASMDNVGVVALL